MCASLQITYELISKYFSQYNKIQMYCRLIDKESGWKKKEKDIKHCMSKFLI